MLTKYEIITKEEARTREHDIIVITDESMYIVYNVLMEDYETIKFQLICDENEKEK